MRKGFSASTFIIGNMIELRVSEPDCVLLAHNGIALTRSEAETVIVVLQSAINRLDGYETPGQPDSDNKPGNK